MKAPVLPFCTVPLKPTGKLFQGCRATQLPTPGCWPLYILVFKCSSLHSRNKCKAQQSQCPHRAQLYAEAPLERELRHCAGCVLAPRSELHPRNTILKVSQENSAQEYTLQAAYHQIPAHCDSHLVVPRHCSPFCQHQTAI